MADFSRYHIALSKALSSGPLHDLVMRLMVLLEALAKTLKRVLKGQGEDVLVDLWTSLSWRLIRLAVGPFWGEQQR